MTLSSPNGSPPDDDKGGLWDTLTKFKKYLAVMVWIPFLLSSGTFIANLFYAIADDGIVDDVEFHNLLQGASGAEMVLLGLVITVLKIRKP